MTGNRRPIVAAVDNEVVPLGLTTDCLLDRRFEELVAFGLPQRGTEVRRILLAKAHIEGSGTGEPDPIAALAEIVGQRGDKAEPTSRLAHRDIARGPAGSVVGLVQGPEPLQS